jgi:hypothetical protein
LDTQAAKYAAAGRFTEAIATAQKAAEVATAAGYHLLAEEIHDRLELYKAGRTDRERPSSLPVGP